MPNPIRVLNVVGRMGQGGIESLIMNIYRNIDRDAVQFDFLCHEGLGGCYEEEIKSLGGRLFEMPKLRANPDEGGSKTYYYKLFEYIGALKKFFKTHPEYHVIHGHMTNTAAIYMPIAKKYGKVTCCIAHSHLTQARPGLSGMITDILHKPMLKVATDFFACSKEAARWIYPQELIDSGKVKIIKNGVDPKRFYYDVQKAIEVKKDLGLEDKFVIGNVARFKTEKNHTFMIDVMENVMKIIPNAVLMLIGDGELRTETEEKVKRLGLENKVIFMGIRSDVQKLMLGMDLFLLPSLYEGLPVVGVEAQAAGLPVVTSTGVTSETDITGNVTFLDLDKGPGVWAENIKNISERFVRRDMTDYIRKNGYDITETAKQLQDFYIKKHNEI